MQKTTLIILVFGAVIAACAAIKKQSLAKLQQGIEGRVVRLTGNQMPMQNRRQASTPKGLATTVYMFEVANISQTKRQGSTALYDSIHTKRIATVQTDSAGHFAVHLPVGSYSIFVKVGNGFYANRFNEQNNINVYRVEKGKLTQVEVMVSEGAVF
ncbi:hypothetical protein [Parasediminibacterium sp. JCM 36343]|uniref:hypothetical protein n=1 Tax=Parasediminibacterium sp. JCM 36343 TaxID=3374279 RepID=UPI003979261A